MSYATVENPLDLKFKTILQEVVDRNCFVIYEASKNKTILDNLVWETLTSLNKSFPKETDIDASFNIQISSALGNMVLFVCKDGTLEIPQILW